MPRFSLKSATISNYLSVTQKVNFPDYGLVYVQGDPGSGKTALGEAIAYTLYGTNPRYSRAGKRVGNFGKGYSVVVEGLIGDSPIAVENSYKMGKATGESLLWTMTKEEIHYPNLDVCRSKLSEMLGVTPMEADWGIFVDGENINWDRLSLTEATNFITGIFNSPRFDGWRDKVKAKLDEYTKLLNESSGKIAMLTVLRNENAEKLKNSNCLVRPIADIEDIIKGLQKVDEELKLRLEACIRDQGSVEKPDATKMDKLVASLSTIGKEELAELELAKASIDNKDLLYAEADLKNVDQTKLQEIRSKMGTVDRSNLEAINKKLWQVKYDLEAARKDLEKKSEAVYYANTRVETCKSKLESQNDKLEKSANNCPTCGLEFVGKMKARAIETAESIKKEILEAEESLRLASDRRDKAVSEHEAALSNIAFLEKELDSSYAELEHHKAAYEDAVSDLKKEEANALKAIEAEKEAKILKVAEERKKYHEKLSNINREIDDFKRSLELQKEDIKSKIKEEQAAIDSHHGITKLRDLKTLESELRKEISSNAALIADEKYDLDLARAARKKTIDLQQERDGINAKIEEEANNQAELDFLTKIAKYWHSASGPSGLPNMILEEIVPCLNAQSQAIASDINGGSMIVRWSAVKQKATGEDTAKLSWDIIDSSGKELHSGTSKGESSRVRFMIASTIAQCASISDKCNFRWYDEVTSGQNAQMCHQVFSWMKRKAQEDKILIFLVDHHPEAAGYADYTLKVSSLDRQTVYSWQ